MVAVIGSKSDCGKTTACKDLVKLLDQNGNRIGVAKLSGTARLGEMLGMTACAHQWLDMADAGLPTTYLPSGCGIEKASIAACRAAVAAERVLQDLAIDNDMIVSEFGEDLLAASVPDILANPSRLNIIALVMAVESATAAIGMEVKLKQISEQYVTSPKNVVGPVANLQVNQRRVMRETSCAGCYDLWNKNNMAASPNQIDASLADTQTLVRKLLEKCSLRQEGLEKKLKLHMTMFHA